MEKFVSQHGELGVAPELSKPRGSSVREMFGRICVRVELSSCPPEIAIWRWEKRAFTTLKPVGTAGRLAPFRRAVTLPPYFVAYRMAGSPGWWRRKSARHMSSPTITKLLVLGSTWGLRAPSRRVPTWTSLSSVTRLALGSTWGLSAPSRSCQ